MIQTSIATRERRIHPAWIAAAVTFLTLVTTAGFRSAPTVLFVPLEDSFGWTRDQISLAFSVNILMYGLTAPFAAALMERFGIRRVVMGALCVVGSGALLTIFMQSAWHLVLLWGLVVGAGTGSMALVFVATIVNRWFVEKRGLVIGILTAAAATGQLIFLPGLSTLATEYGWKSISLTIATGAFIIVPVIALFLRDKPEDIGLLPFGATREWVEPARSEIPAGRLAVTTLRRAIKVGDFWLLAASFFVCGLSTNGLIGTHFIPAAHDHGMGEVAAASLLALVGVFDVVGTILSGWLTDRYDPRRLLFIYYFFRGLSLFLLPSILFQTMHASTLVFVIFYGLDWVATVPPTIILCRNVLGPNLSAVVYGWVFAAHQIGGSLAVLAAGIARVKLGDYSASFYFAGVMCVMAAVLVLRIRDVEIESKVST